MQFPIYMKYSSFTVHHEVQYNATTNECIIPPSCETTNISTEHIKNENFLKST